MADLKNIDLAYACNLPPEKVIEYFGSKGLAISSDWHSLWQEANAKAFTMSRVLKLDVLKTVRDEVLNSIENGLTFKEFQKNLQPQLIKKGFWGRVVNEEGKETFITPHRLKTIYQTNTQSAYMAGRYREMIENADDRPYWQYLAVMDGLTRPAHAALNGKVFRYDDAFWKTHYPPNGFNCRCRIRALRAEQLGGMNITPETTKAADFETITQSAGGRPAEITRYIDPKTGVRMAPDAGWNYNPGEAGYMPNFDKYEYAEAKACVQELINGAPFKMFFEGKIKNDFPVAILGENAKRDLKTKSQTIYLSENTLTEKLKSHKDIRFSNFQNIQNIIENADTIIQDHELKRIFAKREGQILYIVLKTTKSRESLFVVSYRYSSMADIERKKRQPGVIIIKDEL
jgi:SPP1 gp7 family putative phage head morphogenesis protein